MKTKAEKRAKVLELLKSSKYENSRAKRLGTATEAEWQAAKEARIKELES